MADTTDTIVVGYDGTDGSKAALDEAIRVAQRFGAGLIAVFAYDRIIIGGESHDQDAVVSERGHAVLREAAALASAAGVDLRGEYVEDSPARALVAVADSVGARWIVVGSYGERPLRGVLVGSTPYRLLSASERPVLVVRATR